MDEEVLGQEELEVFKGQFREGFGMLLDNDVFLETPLPPDPFSMGFDERTLEELTPQELKEVREILFSDLEADENKPMRIYPSKSPTEFVTKTGVRIPKGTRIDIAVFNTNRTADGIVLQELMFADGEKRWAVGPNIDI